MSNNTVKIAISLPKQDFYFLEKLRRRLGITRSAMIDKAINYWLKRQREEELIRRYEEAYRKKPEEVTEILLLEKAEIEVFPQEEEWS